MLLYAIVHASEIGYLKYGGHFSDLASSPWTCWPYILEHFFRGGFREERLGTLVASRDLGGYYHLTSSLRGVRKNSFSGLWA